MEPSETITELAERYAREDAAERSAVRRAFKLDALRRAGVKLDPALAYFDQFEPVAA
jgi:hypothetical protein